MLDQWVYRPGLPGNAARPDPAAFAAVDRALAAYQRRRDVARDPLCRLDDGGAASLPERPAARNAAREAGGARRRFRLSHSGNAETLFAWLQLALANRYEPAVPAAERFLAANGTAQVRAAAVRDLARPGRMGAADRDARPMPAPAPPITASPRPRSIGRCAARAEEKSDFGANRRTGSRGENGAEFNVPSKLLPVGEGLSTGEPRGYPCFTRPFAVARRARIRTSGGRRGRRIVRSRPRQRPAARSSSS